MLTLDKIIENKVALSGIITLNPSEFIDNDILQLDLKPFLFMELVLKEKDFRQELKEKNWEEYRGKNVAIFCSNDAIIPNWAFMLLSTHLISVHAIPHFGNVETVQRKLLHSQIENINLEGYVGKRIVIKGCGEGALWIEAYVELTKKLQPIAQSIMYGEPCSTVPIYKMKKNI